MDEIPFISREDFITACRDLEQRLLQCGVDNRYVEQNEQPCLIIRRSARDHAPDMQRTLYEGHAPPTEEEEREIELAEGVDPARVDVPRLHPWTVSVEYHILLSATYRVPVLYFQSLFPLSATERTNVEHVLEHLVPPSSRTQIESIGVMGGISMTHHPMNGLTYFNIHPCNTADALREVLSDRTPSPSEYLLIWLGLVGPTVGLNLPKEIVADQPGP